MERGSKRWTSYMNDPKYVTYLGNCCSNISTDLRHAVFQTLDLKIEKRSYQQFIIINQDIIYLHRTRALLTAGVLIVTVKFIRHTVATPGLVGHPDKTPFWNKLLQILSFGGSWGMLMPTPRTKTVILVSKRAWAWVNVIVASAEKSCPRLTVHDDPEQTSDVMEVGAKTPGHAVQKAWLPEMAKRTVNATILNIFKGSYGSWK